MRTEEKLSRMLLQKKLLSAAALEAMQKQAVSHQQTLFQYLTQHQNIRAEKLALACSTYFNKPLVSTDQMQFQDIPFDGIPFEFIQKNRIIPLSHDEKKWLIAIANPEDIDIGKTLSYQLNLSVDIAWMQYDVLYRLHNRYLSESCYKKAKENEASAKAITHQLLSDAIHRQASDIHIEHYQQSFRIRFRLNGLLHEITTLPISLSDGMISCIKVLAQLDIAIKRMPQDGRLSFYSYLGWHKDCRVSTCPTVFGEKVVIRLLDNNTSVRAIHELGLHDKDQMDIIRSIQQPQGLILVTGPTGSGKTITLYTLLAMLNEKHRNIVTIEDPVEMQITGINQTPINSKTGLTFSHTLRALLRQDPDVIMIGEIRDQETAEMALRAAQTGHLVLTTLHTNSTAEAITRLRHMGIAPFHLASALTLVIAQRLVRKLCVHCKSADVISDVILKEAGFSKKIETLKLYQSQGCFHCSDGFHGRMGIFELLPINQTIKQLILNNANHTEIAAKNNLFGHDDLWQSALTTVKNGVTSLNEIYRAIPKQGCST